MAHCSVSLQACELELTVGSHFRYGSVVQVSELQPVTSNWFNVCRQQCSSGCPRNL